MLSEIIAPDLAIAVALAVFGFLIYVLALAVRAVTRKGRREDAGQ